MMDPKRINPARIASRPLAAALLLLALLAFSAPAWAAKIEVCHIPPGNPGNLHTITISEHALQAHLAHGDFLGDCSAAPCPCMRIPQFNLVLANVNFCAGSGESDLVSKDPPVEGPDPLLEVAFAEAPNIGSSSCGYVNLNTQTSIVLTITLAEATLCRQVIQDAAASRGVSCVP